MRFDDRSGQTRNSVVLGFAALPGSCAWRNAICSALTSTCLETHSEPLDGSRGFPGIEPGCEAFQDIGYVYLLKTAGGGDRRRLSGQPTKVDSLKILTELERKVLWLATWM